MLKPLPSLRQLRYLTALADHLHFGRAAEACLATQSTVSAALADLETLLGATLVERTRRRVLLTALGQAVVDRARPILAQAEDIYDLARMQSAEPLSGVVRLGVIPTIAPYALPPAMTCLRVSYPHLHLHLREDLTARLLDRLGAGELDVVLIALPYALEGVETMDLAEDPFIFVCASDHPLAAKSIIGPADLAGPEMILLEEGHCLREHALAACPLPLGQTGAAMQATSLGTLVQMVAGGLGVTLLPEIAVRGGILNNTGAVTRPLAPPRVTRTLALGWRRTSVRKAEFLLLGDQLRASATTSIWAIAQTHLEASASEPPLF